MVMSHSAEVMTAYYFLPCFHILPFSLHIALIGVETCCGSNGVLAERIDGIPDKDSSGERVRPRSSHVGSSFTPEN